MISALVATSKIRKARWGAVSSIRLVTSTAARLVQTQQSATSAVVVYGSTDQRTNASMGHAIKVTAKSVN